MKAKKARRTRWYVINLKFKYFKNCLKAYQIINKINYLEDKGINVESLK